MMDQRRSIRYCLLLGSLALLLGLSTGCLSEALGMRGDPTPVIPTITNPTATDTPIGRQSTPTNVPIPTVEPTLTPTPTLEPTPIVEPILTPDIQATVQAGIQQILESQTPTPIPTPLPTPLPTPRYRPVEPQQSLGVEQFKFTEGPILLDHFRIRFIASIEAEGLEPTQVQVFQSLRFEDYGGTCSTEKPIAFVLESGGFGSVRYPWPYCPYPGANLIPCGDTQRGCSSSNPDASVPFLNAELWDYEREACIPPIPRSGNRNPPPCTPLNIWTWEVVIDWVDNNQVRDRTYNSPAGYILVIFSGETILGRVWIDGL